MFKGKRLAVDVGAVSTTGVIQPNSILRDYQARMVA